MPTVSAYPPITVPNQDIFSFLFEREDRAFPDDHVLYVDGSTKRQLTFANVRDQSRAFGIGLKSLWGWKKGDVLAIFSTNQLDTPPVTWGTHWAAGVLSPANPTYTVEELAFQLKNSGAKALITIPELLPVATKAAASVGLPNDRIIIMGDQRTKDFKHWREIVDSGAVIEWRRTKVNPAKDLAFLVYSSGTTGHPKGVMLSHRNIVVNVLQLVTGEGNNVSWKNDKIIAFLPFFHIYGLSCIMHHAMFKGLTTVIMSRFDLPKFCEHVQDFKITYAYVVPPVILLLAKSPVVDKYDLSSLRMLNSGAAPLTRELVLAASKRLRVPVKQGYGLSETSPVTHGQRWEDWESHIGSVGRLLPNLTAKYMSEDEKEVPAGQTGELWVKGDNVMLGYLNNPEATKNAITEDGYFKTGDVGYQDEQGNFYITDRVKELIKYKGFQVPPAELEGLLLSCDKVDDCAVAGVYSDELASEVPHAFIVVAKGVEENEETAKEIIQFIHEKVAQHKRLRGGVRFMKEIPKSASGKILRRVLKSQAAAEATPKAKL
ncbi:hypothetical protein RUND412_004367 [Rhizina undulata]